MSLAVGCLGPVIRLPEGTAYKIRLDDRSRTDVHRLQVGIGTDRQLSVKIAPWAGANAYSFQVNGIELLRQPASLDELGGFRYGIPLLYPTPGAVREGTFAFEGREYRFPVGLHGHHTHGLVNQVVWEVGELEVEEDGICLPLSLDVTRDHPLYERFPFEHSIRVKYRLSAEGLLIGVEIKNRDTRRLPFGFGILTNLRLLGERPESYISLPANRLLKRSPLNGLPTGELEDVIVGGPRDLRAPVSLGGLRLDSIYSGLLAGRPAGYEARDRGIRVSLEASELFSHAVVRSLPGEDFISLGYQTCADNAHNLYAAGHTDAAHLLILEPLGDPGSTFEGSVFIRVEVSPPAVPGNRQSLGDLGG
ncbi:MAG: aldose 1-epimerase [Planctomycetota bacterium]|nr:aldose 1-epimerase [Planctomycetota bacterium]